MNNITNITNITIKIQYLSQDTIKSNKKIYVKNIYNYFEKYFIMFNINKNEIMYITY